MINSTSTFFLWLFW